MSYSTAAFRVVLAGWVAGPCGFCMTLSKQLPTTRANRPPLAKIVFRTTTELIFKIFLKS